MESFVWPGRWALLLTTPVPLKEDNHQDDARLDAGLLMLDLGCEDDQIAFQLNWKLGGTALKGLRKLHSRLKKLRQQETFSGNWRAPLVP